MKVKKKQQRVEGTSAYVPFRTVEILAIDRSDYTTKPLAPAGLHEALTVDRGIKHMTCLIKAFKSC